MQGTICSGLMQLAYVDRWIDASVKRSLLNFPTKRGKAEL